MKRLEKITSVSFLIVGVGLFSYGLYKDKPTLAGLGLIPGSCSAGLALREEVEEDNKKYFENKKQ